MKLPDSTALGFLRVGSEYLRAAELVLPPAKTEVEAFRQRLSLPAYFLVGHAIELALKAFLFSRGLSVARLRSREYGHNLISLLNEARRRKLGNLVKLAKAEVVSVRLLDEMYSTKEFEYSANGVRGLPHYAVVYSAAEKLCTGLRAHCVRLASNPFIERTSQRPLRALCAAAHVER